MPNQFRRHTLFGDFKLCHIQLNVKTLKIIMDGDVKKLPKKSVPSKQSYSYQKKKPPPKPRKRQNDIYITTKSNYKAQQKFCKDLLNSGLKEIYLHCLGNAVNRGLNLALDLVNSSNDTLSYSLNTSTIHLIDEFHPLCDDEDITIQKRNNSAIHIKITRNSAYDVDIGCDL